MKTSKKAKFVPSGGEIVHSGVPTTTLGIGGAVVTEYLTPRKSRPVQESGVVPDLISPIPSLLSTLEQEQQWESGDAESHSGQKPQPKTPHVHSSDLLDEWGQRFLDIMYEMEADVAVGKRCPRCKVENTQACYRCRECFHSCVLCEKCMVQVHTHNPLHFVEYWNGNHFERRTLAQLGLILRLGHSGDTCPSSKNTTGSTVTIVHTTGIQDVRIMYCECRRLSTHEIRARPLQLLAARLWPTSYHRLRTAITLSALRYFQQLSFQSKIPAYDFIATLRRLTNNAFGSDMKDRYREFLRVYRHYQFLSELKWNGLSVSRTLSPGSLAVLCPACPQPGINMDPEWQERPRHLWYLDALHYGKDGNFRLNQHNKKMDELDVPLTEGAAYYASSAKHLECKRKVEGRPDLDGDTYICSEFQALKDRYSGKKVSGQISLSCTRHEMVLPSGTIDLDKGEKYVHVDYATIACISPRYLQLKLLFESYDIACKYGIKWEERMLNLGESPPDWPLILRVVPKWHANAHTGPCRTLNSLEYMPGVGDTDGEAPERHWSVMDSLGRSTQEMGVGLRIDVLNAHKGDYNIQKLFHISTRLAAKYKKALVNRAKLVEELRELELAIQENESCRVLLEVWRKREAEFLAAVVTPDAARRKYLKSPYVVEEEAAPSMQEVVATIHQEYSVEAKHNSGSKRGRSHVSDEIEDEPIISPAIVASGVFVLKDAMELEQRQRELREMVAQYNSATVKDAALYNRIQHKRESLDAVIGEWQAHQATVMGQAIAQLKIALPNIDWPERSDRAEEYVLPIPSNLPSTIRDHQLCEPFTRTELKLRQGMANDLLKELRSRLQLVSMLWKKYEGHTNQRNATRSTQSMSGVQKRIREIRKLYNGVRERLVKLGEPANSRYQVLTDKDCQPSKLYHSNQRTESQKSVSWVHRTTGLNEDDSIMSKWQIEVTRVEWFKASARAQRSREAVLLLEAEMQRVQRFFAWYQDQWAERTKNYDDSPVGRGRVAFAARQSVMYEKLWCDARALFPEALHV